LKTPKKVVEPRDSLTFEEAEKKIELLTKKADGSVALKPFAADEPKDDEDEKEAKLL
jgi:hypothetical protein